MRVARGQFVSAVSFFMTGVIPPLSSRLIDALIAYSQRLPQPFTVSMDGRITRRS